MSFWFGKIQFKGGSVSVLHSLVITSTVALSHRKPSSTGASNYSCNAQDTAKRNALYLSHSERVMFLVCHMLFKHTYITSCKCAAGYVMK